MSNTTIWIVVVVIALAIVFGLAFYAGRLLFLLKRQTEKQNQLRNDRIANMTESIRTIALAMQQQQCNFSEGSIRICRLLDSLPIENVARFRTDFPAIHKLFDSVQRFATHEERMALSKQQRRSQDREREEIEAEMESEIQKELPKLRELNL